MKILSMSGFVPETICDVVRFSGYTGDRNISHYCGYANDFISQAINDATVDGVVFPKSCDSSRIIKSYLADISKFVYQINVPASTDETAIDFLAKELADYKTAIESYYQVSLDDIPSRIRMVNKRNAFLNNYYCSLENHSYGDYLRMVHSIMRGPLSESMSAIALKEKSRYNKRIYLVGSFLSNEHIADIIEANGLGIVGDNLPESGRIAGLYIYENAYDVYMSTAQYILRQRLSPTQNNFKTLIDEDIWQIKKLQADAVIFVTQKYCEPYEYLYSVYKKKLDELGVPSLKLSVTDSEDERKIELNVGAFAGMI